MWTNSVSLKQTATYPRVLFITQTDAINRKIFIAAAIIAVVFGIGIVATTNFETNSSNAGPVQSAYAQEARCGPGYHWMGTIIGCVQD
jgi:hypothetical protein